MTRVLAVLTLALACAACDRAPVEPPPRHFMRGGVWYPAATGYWFHQYATNDDIERLMADLRFTCVELQAEGGSRLRCERGFRVPGLLARTDYAEFAFRRNGAVALAQSGCRYAFFGVELLSGTCTPYAARGAVYPDVRAFAAMTEAMLRPARIGQAANVFALPRPGEGPLPDAEEAVERLARWRFECESPNRRYKGTFRGNVGEIREIVCRQWSLGAQDMAPQEQHVILRYDTADLALLDLSVRLDGNTAPLSRALLTPRDARARGEPPPLALTTIAGERFEVSYGSIGTGSRQQTREAFVTLTPESQRALVQAYLDKTMRSWRSPLEKLSQANLASIEWYGPEALPHLDALASDENPDLGAAVLRARCLDARDARSGNRGDAEAMAACIEARRAAMPRSVATLDRLIAAEVGTLARMDARALNAFQDFRRDAVYVVALGPDARESSAALAQVVAGKEGLDPGLSELVATALSQRPREAPR